MCVLVCLSVGFYMCMQFLKRPKEGINFPGARVTEIVYSQHGHWKLELRFFARAIGVHDP